MSKCSCMLQFISWLWAVSKSTVVIFTTKLVSCFPYWVCVNLISQTWSIYLCFITSLSKPFHSPWNTCIEVIFWFIIRTTYVFKIINRTSNREGRQYAVTQSHWSQSCSVCEYNCSLSLFILICFRTCIYSNFNSSISRNINHIISIT